MVAKNRVSVWLNLIFKLFIQYMNNLNMIEKWCFYDLIFMDIHMPVMNGYEATAAIRSHRKYREKQIPIIAMTANAFAEDIINSRISGMDEHLTKPLEPARLVNVLKDCIWRRKHKL